jgi:hypothetical protein
MSDLWKFIKEALPHAGVAADGQAAPSPPSDQTPPTVATVATVTVARCQISTQKPVQALPKGTFATVTVATVATRGQEAGSQEGARDHLPATPETPETPPSGTANATLGVSVQAPLPPPPPPAPAPVRPWSAADWRLFRNDRQAAAEIALGEMPAQARTYAYVCCIREWRRVRPGSSEAQAIVALAEKGIIEPSSPPHPRP